MRGDLPQYTYFHPDDRKVSPPPRGSTFRRKRPRLEPGGCPVRAGISLEVRVPTLLGLCLPRMRGDPPLVDHQATEAIKVALHARGFLGAMPVEPAFGRGCPARAGIFLERASESISEKRLPRMRGDFPVDRAIERRARRVAPHTWGFSGGERVRAFVAIGCPAPSGIFLVARTCSRLCTRFPRTRGDFPFQTADSPENRRVAPHARGSSFLFQKVLGVLPGCPVCAGIYHDQVDYERLLRRLPRCRGDLSMMSKPTEPHETVTPYMRGSTGEKRDLRVEKAGYPARVGIFPGGF